MSVDGLIAQVALPVPLRRLFDYRLSSSAETDLRGSRVKVSFGRRQLVGVIMHQTQHSAIKAEQLKTIEHIYEESLFPHSLCNFIEKMAHYYHYPIGEVAFTGMPSLLRQGKACPSTQELTLTLQQGFVLNAHQQDALDSILQANQFQAFLLEGITGSGKTEIYLQAAAQQVKQNKQVLILVPEISLTPQTEQRFKQRFGESVLCYHSRLSPLNRLNAWLQVRHQQVHIIIGTRSAIFLPFADLGLIVIDEEHDPSFKQQEGFRYSARDGAVLRAKAANCSIILGSATPAFESLFNAKMGKYQKLILPKRATQTLLPEIIQIDIRHKKLEGGLSPTLLQAIGEELAHGQVLLFINRRGYAPTLMCFSCQWIAHCQQCDARLTYHQSGILLCHHCSFQMKKPDLCPHCQANALHPIGQGTQRLESVLRKHFPTINLARIDSDVTRKKGILEDLLAGIQKREIPLLIGTQILAKGHHFPHLSLVAIVDTDGGLFSVDFRAIERMAQLIIQVAGRAGRVHQAGKVMIQTFHPEHPLLKQILQQDYRQLADSLLLERQRCQLPPFSHLALIRAQAKTPERVQKQLKSLQSRLLVNPSVQIIGPLPAPMLKRQGNYHYQLLIQAHERKALHQVLSYAVTLLESIKNLKWSLDVDPIEMF